MTPSRIAHALVALLALAGLALHYAIVLAHGGDLAMRTLHYLSFYTILANGLVAAAAIAHLLPDGGRLAGLARADGRTAVTLHILVVATIFHLLLRQTMPGMIGLSANLLVHTVVPLGWVACWLAFPPHGGIARTAPWRWLLFPLGFAGWTLAHGAAAGWYPYPFLDVVKLGYPAVSRTMALIALLFVMLGFALRWADARLARRVPPDSVMPAEAGISGE